MRDPNTMTAEPQEDAIDVFCRKLARRVAIRSDVVHIDDLLALADRERAWLGHRLAFYVGVGLALVIIIIETLVGG